jgi:ABC-type branched-subunit amino acid transport system permease subunit
MTIAQLADGLGPGIAPGIGAQEASALARNSLGLSLGLLFVLSVYFFPRGIVGQLRQRAARRSPRLNAPAAGTATP